MKKIIYAVIALSSIWLLTACSSAEADEVLEFHNDMVDYVNPRMDDLLELNDEILWMTSEEDALELQKNEIIPALKEIQDYIHSKDPKYEITKEYHELIRNWMDALSEAVHLETEAVEGLLAGTLTEDEAWELIRLSEEAVDESLKYDKQVYDKWEEIKEEYNFEDME